MSIHAWAYRTGRLTRRRLHAPVVSVGNLVAGGTGKTPVVAALARQFRDRGHRVAILSRGYGRKGSALRVVSTGSGPLIGWREAGDEPFLLARDLPGVSVVVGADRVAAGELAETQLRADLHLLDDGFQHRRLERDLDILLLDAATTHERLRLLPAGPLREPLSAIGRADLILLTRAHRDHDQVGIRRLVRAANPRAPIYTVEPRFLGLEATDGRFEGLARLTGQRVLAISGLGDPLQFEQDLERLGAVLVGRLRFRDHHPYRRVDLERIARTARRLGADLVVTTRKDLVRIDSARLPALPLFALAMEAVVRDAVELGDRIEAVLAPAAKAGH